MANVFGEDRSSFQAVGSWAGDYFGFAKATEGLNWLDPTFAANWRNLRAEGKVRGAYHFFHPADDPVAQARFFITSVTENGGIADGDVFIADVEIAVGADGLEAYGTDRAPYRTHCGLWGDPVAAAAGPAALAFLNEVAALAGPQHRVALYTDLSMAQSQLGDCTGYPLFIAYYSASPPPGVSPWRAWSFWQTGATAPGGGDADYFSGTEADLLKWAHPGPAPLPPDWIYPPVQKLTAAGGETTVKLEWDAPAAVPGQVPMPGIQEYDIAIAPGPSLSGPDVTSYPRHLAKGKNPETWQGGSLARRKQYTAGVRARLTAADGHAGKWATVTFSTT